MTKILIEKNVMVPMRDGAKLATDIYRLEGVPPTPVLVVRTPYDKDNMVTNNDAFNIFRAVQSGYAVVTQDVRGRFASEGSNTGGIIARESRDRYQPAINRIFHDAAHPSHLILPIISH